LVDYTGTCILSSDRHLPQYHLQKFLFQVSIIRGIAHKNYMEAGLSLLLLIIPLLYLPINLIYTIKTTYLGVFLISPYDTLPTIYYVILSFPILLFLVYMGLDYALSKIRLKKPLLITVPLTVIIAYLFILFSGKSSTELEQKILQVEEAALNNEWNEFANTGMNRLVQFEVNRALYHTGQLLDNLFWHPQPYAENAIFLETSNFSSRGSFHMSDFYEDLGFAAETRHWATEAQMYLKRNPAILKHLVLSYLAEDKIEIALKYLNVLSASGLYREWCEEIKDIVNRKQLQDNLVIASFIKNNPKVDFFDSASDPIKELGNFYSNNPDNHIAFEFLIASYLLRHRIGDVVNHIMDFRRFGYKTLPRNVEEAVLIYVANNRDKPIQLAGYPISEKTQSDFTNFNKILLSKKNRNEARNMVQGYRNTYWYYILFSSPYATKK